MGRHDGGELEADASEGKSIIWESGASGAIERQRIRAMQEKDQGWEHYLLALRM